MIYVGGKNLDAKNFKVVFNSPYLSVTPETLTNQNFGSEISVVSFEVNVKPQIPFGQYSFALQKTNDSTQYFVGGLTIENFPNLLSDFVLNIDD